MIIATRRRDPRPDVERSAEEIAGKGTGTRAFHAEVR